MAVYIKGLNKKDISDLRVHKYGGAYEFVEYEDIIEVKTPHGRLIDADAEYKALLEMKVEGEVFANAVEFAKIEMEQAPTVIEAEVE